jgi:hypothetical protein
MSAEGPSRRRDSSSSVKRGLPSVAKAVAKTRARLRNHGRKHNPTLRPPLQPRQQPSVEQRRFAAARRADNSDEPASAPLQRWLQKLSKSRISRSRPKKTAAFSIVNASEPGYGDRRGSHATESAGSRPFVRNPASRAATPLSSLLHSIHWVPASNSSLASRSRRKGKIGLPRDLARHSSAKHQREVVELRLARKTTPSVFRSCE